VHRRLKIVRFSYVAGLIAALVLAAFVLCPRLDLTVSGWFAIPGHGFIWQDARLLQALSWLAYYGARALGVLLAAGGIAALLLRRPFVGFSAKAWLFLLLGLLLGPGLVANVVFKDHWGRARPREITEFGGKAAYSSPLVMQQGRGKNGSFVSGDAAFGFFLPSFAYAVPLRRSRRVFWGGMILGAVFGLARVISGAHFLSDVLFAAAFMLLTAAALYSAMFGWEETRSRWLAWLGKNRA
jgi:lipid A 4'-phosphatase